jgi:LPS export ABC transporter protein LptC
MLTALTAVTVLSAGAVGCSGVDQPPTTTSVADSADNLIYGLDHSLTTDGIRSAYLEADSAYFYTDAQETRLYELRVTFFATTGQERSVVTADSGLYDGRSGDMIARGNVVALTPDGRRLTTSELRYERRSDQITGPAPFVFMTADGQRQEGDAFRSDPDFRNVVVTRGRGELGTVEIER